jgi:adenosylcobinamide-GDP ribazoletransferase
VSRGLQLAVSWLTILPVGTPVEVDRNIARQALYWAPLVGAVLGLLAAGLLTMMRDGATGPFGVVALVLVLSAQAAALGTLAETGRLIPVVLATVAGRAAFGWCARMGVPPARPAGLGALVADSQPPAVPVAWSTTLLAGALVAVPGRSWQGPLAVGLAALAVLALSAHTRRRFGGVTGDVLGAAAELTTTVVLAVCAIG